MSDMEKSEKSLNMAFERVIYIYTTNPSFSYRWEGLFSINAIINPFCKSIFIVLIVSFIYWRGNLILWAIKTTYREHTDMENTLKLRQVLATLPPFCKDYFRKLMTTTTAKTRISYAYDIRIFFQFLDEKSCIQRSCHDWFYGWCSRPD